MINILNFFEQDKLKEKNDGSFQTICPDCGLQGGRTEGFILFPETNTWFCHSSNKHGGILELIAIKNKIIKCIDCCESKEKRNVLEGELFIEVLQCIKNNYDENFYNEISIAYKIKEKVKTNEDLISKTAKNYANALAKYNKIFYRIDSRDIVEVMRIKSLKNKKYTYVGFSSIKPPRFITLSENYIIPFKEFETKKLGIIEVNASITSNLATILLQSPQFQDILPKIKRIFTIQIPILYENKLTFAKKGYDERFESWMDYDTPIINKPDMNLKEAKNIIDNILSEFCFQNKQDKTNAIAGLITPFLRGLFSSFSKRTPVFFYLANRERAGKDYLAGITGIIYEGFPLEENPISTSENAKSNNNEELRKKILSAMIGGRKRMHFSNNKGYINNAILESISTAEKYSDRVLGRNEILSFDNELDFSLSGNVGVGYTPDFANRCRFVRLFLDIEDANSRKFKNPNLHEWVKENRELILSALYSLVRNWFNKKHPSGVIPFTSFPEWANICGGIMVSAGYDNPCIADEETLALGGDSETQDMKRLFEICYEEFKDKWITKKDIINYLIKTEEELFGYIDFDKMSGQVKFGKKIVKFIGRVLSDIRLVLQDNSVRTSRQIYKFESIKNNFVCKVGKVGKIGKVAIPKLKFNKNIYIIGNTLPTLPTLPSLKNKKLMIKKLKTDREIQFYNAKECKNIITKCKEEDVLKWVEGNLKKDYKEGHKIFGIGFYKHINKLRKKGKIK